MHAGLSATSHRVCAGEREFFVLVCACRAAHTDSADDLSVDNDRDSADQRSESIHRGHGCAAFVDQFLKEPCWFLEKNRSARLANRDGCSHRERPIEAFKRHQVAALVNDCNHSTRSIIFLRVVHSGSDCFFGPVEVDRFLFYCCRRGR